MSEQITPVERAAGLYETALQESRGKTCSEEHFNFKSKEEALAQVASHLVMEGMEEASAMSLARAGKLLASARRMRRLR